MVPQKHLETFSHLILFAPNEGVEEKKKNVGLIPFPKILSFPSFINAWHFPHRVPRILIMKNNSSNMSQIQTWKGLYCTEIERGFFFFHLVGF